MTRMKPPLTTQAIGLAETLRCRIRRANPPLQGTLADLLEPGTWWAQAKPLGTVACRLLVKSEDVLLPFVETMPAETVTFWP